MILLRKYKTEKLTSIMKKTIDNYGLATEYLMRSIEIYSIFI